MRISSKPKSAFILATLLGFCGCNMYVIDFENRLPDGSVLAPKAVSQKTEPVQPITGSDGVAFMDSTTAQLEGCRVIAKVQISQIGSFEDGLVELRNNAHRMNANRIIPLRFIEGINDGAPSLFSAKMVRCPAASLEIENG